MCLKYEFAIYSVRIYHITGSTLDRTTDAIFAKASRRVAVDMDNWIFNRHDL